MTEEEARAKLSLDTSDLERGKQHIERFSQDAHKSFLHPTSAARGFHKVMEQMTDAVPVLGRAINIAISPIAGTFAAAAAGIAFANDRLKEFNRSMDEMANKAARPITNAGAASEAAQKRVGDVLNQMGAFERAQRDKVPVLTGLSELENVVLSGMAPGAQRDAMERSFIGSAQGRLWAQAVKLERQRIAAGIRAANPSTQKAISHSQDVAKHLRGEIDETSANLGKIQGEAATQSGLAGFDLGEFLSSAGQSILSQFTDGKVPETRQQLADKTLDTLQKQKEELKKVEEQLKKLTEADKKNNEELKEKEHALDKILDSIRELQKEYAKIPAAQSATPVITSVIDPLTGGVAYRPLSDKGGIAYRPLPGAMGFQPIVPTSPANLAQNDPLVLLNIKMQQLVSAATEAGIVLKLPE